MRKFKSKKQILKYIKKKFSNKYVKGIIIRGSTAKGRLKDFSDIDIEIYTEKLQKPYYEIIEINKKLILISAYFYRPKNKKKKQKPKNVLILYGDYFEKIEHKDKYNKNEKTIRNNQMFIDFLFKYLRTRNKKYLNKIEKYSRLK